VWFKLAGSNISARGYSIIALQSYSTETGPKEHNSMALATAWLSRALSTILNFYQKQGQRR
jgi:hypothetical protein